MGKIAFNIVVYNILSHTSIYVTMDLCPMKQKMWFGSSLQKCLNKLGISTKLNLFTESMIRWECARYMVTKLWNWACEIIGSKYGLKSLKEGNSGNNCTDANPIKDQQGFMDLFRSGLRLPSGSFPKSNELFKNSDGIPIDFLKNSKCIKQMADFC